MASGVQLLLAAVYLTARYCTAQELVNTAVKYHFWKTFQKHTAKGLGGGSAGGKHTWSSLVPQAKSIYLIFF